MNVDKSLWKGQTLGVIGGGNMAEALLSGVTAAGLLAPVDILVFDVLPNRRAVFEKMGCRAAPSVDDALSASAVLLAVKPQNMGDALEAARDAQEAARDAQEAAAGVGRLFISIAAGVTTAALARALPKGSRVVRVMPNTPLLVGRGASALCRGPGATDRDMAGATALFACGGDAVEVAEEAMDAVTALSGSGPAYVFLFAEALFRAGEEMGLAPELARRLAIGTIAGAAEMLVRDGDAAELRRRVTSPGGTTAAALVEFEKGDFKELVVRAAEAARARSAELGRGR